MSSAIHPWLQTLSRLRVDRAHETPAPHKPLLLLCLLDQIAQGVLTTPQVRLTPALAFRFLTYWEIVATRRPVMGRVELPFFHLQGDGLLRLVAHSGMESTLKSLRATSVEALNQVVAYGELPLELFQLMEAAEHRDAVRRVLIAGDWFLPAERLALNTLLGFPPATPEIDDPRSEILGKISRTLRFRLQIVPTYHYACALCGVKILLPSGMTLVEAAHIHPFARSHNDEVTNGLALCRNHHWAFDAGLWSATADFRVQVAADHFLEVAPQQRALRDFQGESLRLADLPVDQRPAAKHLAWHRKHRFLGQESP